MPLHQFIQCYMPVNFDTSSFCVPESRFIMCLGRSVRHKVLLVDENANKKVSQLRLCPEQDLNSQFLVQDVEDDASFRPL